MKILITDASVKHSIAIQRYLHLSHPMNYLIGHDVRRLSIASCYPYLNKRIWGSPLEAVLASEQFDMVIPVGAQSVRTVAAVCPSRAVLPDRESLETAFDKYATVLLAERLGVPCPRTMRIRKPEDLNYCDISPPCVIKPSREIDVKAVNYARTKSERDQHAVELLGRVPSSHGVIIQEYVQGQGCGVGVLCVRGGVVRLFMHERIREYPVTGGASTAARAFYDPVLKDYAFRLLRELRWHGLAMVEFKRQPATNRFVLMEINPKCWGSMELAMYAGVNFPADLVRAYRGESIAYSEAYDRDCRFYWPLDGDIQHLLEVGRLGDVRQYWAPGAHTNVGQSIPADILKILRVSRDVVKHLFRG